MILCSNPRAQYFSHKREIDEAIKHVLENGWYILGEEVKSFEKEFATYIGTNDSIGVGSGTEALHLALICCGIGKGDEVITVSHTAVATVAAIELAGASPVFVDIEPEFYTIDPTNLKKAITAKTKAIIPVHIYGQSCNIDAILEIAKKHELKVIEDCSQAHGASYKGRCVGSFGDFGCFSFYPTKNLGALGDGGMIVTNNTELANKAQLLREYGWEKRYVSDYSGWNTRLDEIQAAILRIKLKYLNNDNLKRNLVAEIYNRELKDYDLLLPKIRNQCKQVYHQYVVRSEKRDELLLFLKNNEINALIHYPVPVHLQPTYRKYCNRELIETEKVAKQILSLPIYPELLESEIYKVVSVISEFYHG